jgi:hypothetical protein
MGCLEGGAFTDLCSYSALVATDSEGAASVIYKTPAPSALGDRESVLIIVRLDPSPGEETIDLESVAVIEFVVDDCVFGCKARVAHFHNETGYHMPVQTLYPFT